MRELELKYRIEDEKQAEALLESLRASPMKKEGSDFKKKLRTKYYDTKEMALSKKGMAFRIRNVIDASIKFNLEEASKEQIVQDREEINFKIEGIPEGLELLFESKINRFGMQFEINKSTVEVVIDMGEVLAGEKSETILELEAELLQGKDKDLFALGREIEHKYGLVQEAKTKFARGMELI
ncbi:MAG: CYTH domain-containing protein [Anaerovoracaceae bacterium]